MKQQQHTLQQQHRHQPQRQQQKEQPAPHPPQTSKTTAEDVLALKCLIAELLTTLSERLAELQVSKIWIKS